MSDFSKNQGGVQPSNATGRDPKHSDKPKTGFVEAPTGDELGKFGTGPGVGNSRKGIR